MKIIILTSSFPYGQGDFHGKFIYHQALGQVRLGNEVHVICPHFPGRAFEETIDGIRVHRFAYFYPYRFQRLSTETGMYLSLSRSFLAWFQLPIFLISEWYAANRVVSRFHIDVIHSHWIVPQGFAGVVCKITRHKPHLVSSHVADAQVFVKWRSLKPLLRLILSGTDMLTTNSTFTKNIIGNLLPVPCPVRVIPMGVVPVEPDWSGKPDPNAPRILYVGRLIEWKGIDTLIRAMGSVVRAKPDAILTIVGSGEEQGHLESLSRDLGIADHVHFAGQVSDDQLSNLYSCSTVLVLPSQSSRGFVMEGLGVVLLEAMSHGVPVIGSNTGGIPDIIDDGKNGSLFPAGDDKVLAEKILCIVSDPEKARRFRGEGYETVRLRFSWDAISEKFSEAYGQITKA